MPPQSRLRPRLSRTFSRARWREYERLLFAGLAAGYDIASLENWLLDRKDTPERLLVLRHDVDQHPRSALRMAAIEERLGLRSTWYFRWRTAHPRVIRRLRAAGHDVGFHYETLSRTALTEGVSETAGEGLVERCRPVLRQEIAEFARLHGHLRSVCPHGDSRVPGIANATLLKGQDWRRFGIEMDGNQAMHGRPLGYWLTDRSTAEGKWVDRVDPLALLSDGVSPILSITHPNNWASGPDLWVDRLLSGMLPRASDRRGWLARPIRTGVDRPPVAAS